MDLTGLSAAEIFISLPSIMVLERKNLITETLIGKATIEHLESAQCALRARYRLI